MTERRNREGTESPSNHATGWVVLLASVLLSACNGSRVADNAGPATSFLERKAAPVFRVLNWNVKRNAILFPKGARHDSFRRIIRAVDPDVICLQEVLHPQAGEILTDALDQALPLPGGRYWTVHSVADNVVLSRYPLPRREGEAVVPVAVEGAWNFAYGQARVLVDWPHAPHGVYLYAVHNRSRSGPERREQRQWQSDAMVQILRNLKDPGHPEALPHGTPIIIAGDLNVLAAEPADPLRHLVTLLTGDIIDEARFGPDIRPDWDESNLIEVKPRLNGRQKDYYTWRDDSEPFPPGALDRILYTDSVLTISHAYVLDTTAMSAEELARAGLLASDVLLDAEPGRYDHLPMVADFVLESP